MPTAWRCLVLLVLCVTVYSKPGCAKMLRPLLHTNVLTICSICISLLHVLIKNHGGRESIYGASDPWLAHSVGVCPDAYVLNETHACLRPRQG
jgi:hypothetical protein